MLIKGRCLIIYFRIRKFRMYMFIPTFLVTALLWEFMEFVDLVGDFRDENIRKIKKGIPAVFVAIDGFKDVGRFDLVEIKVEDHKKKKVEIIVKVR